MAKVRMVAVKMLRYASRMMRRGEEFEATPKDAKVLSAVGLARIIEERETRVIDTAPKRKAKQPLPQDPGPAAPAPVLPASEPAPALPPLMPLVDDRSDQDEVDALAAEYEKLTGNAPDGRWRAARIEREIENHKRGAGSNEG